MARIAVVEDNPDNRLLIQALLEDDHELTEFENGADALDGMLESPPELVLLDISLPRMDGTEVLRRMRDDARLVDVPVIALTAHAMSGDRERFIQQGFDDYISKPIVDHEILIGSIERLLNRAG